MITLAIPRPEHTQVATIEVASESTIADSVTALSTNEITAAEIPLETSGPSDDARFDGTAKLILPLSEFEWTSKLEREFSALADKSINGKLQGASDNARFRHLLSLRRRLHHPRRVDEILYEQERSELLADLANSLSRCVKFLDVRRQDSTRPSA
jgi:hypothetical protein